jgi:hypothetical protein
VTLALLGCSDGDLLRCTFTLNDLPPSPEGGGTVVLPGSHRGGMDEPAGVLADGYGEVLNSSTIKALQRMPVSLRFLSALVLHVLIGSARADTHARFISN